MTQSDSPKIQKWREEISKRSQEVTKQKSSEVAVAVEKAKQKSSEILEATKQKGVEVMEAAIQTSTTAVELAKQKSAELRNEKVESEVEEKTGEESDEEWEAPSIDEILGTIFWSLLGYKW